MVLEYNTSNRFEALAPILEEYASWFGRVAICVAYHERATLVDKLATPAVFEEWLAETRKNESFPPGVLNDLESVYNNMLSASEKLIESLNSDQRPSLQDFSDFKDCYLSFLIRTRRLEKDSALEGSGIEEETGLRRKELIEDDLKKELQRLSRQGHPFSLILCRIDGLAGKADQAAVIALAVNNIKRCMRPFDDAYYMGLGHFLISLKQADIIGAQAATSRLQMNLKNDEKNTEKMTLSYSLAEPVAEDKSLALIQNMQKDLDKHLNDNDAVLKFVEVSTLEQYVKSINK